MGKYNRWPPARNPDRSWCHRHTSLKLSWLQSFMDSRIKSPNILFFPSVSLPDDLCGPTDLIWTYRTLFGTAFIESLLVEVFTISGGLLPHPCGDRNPRMDKLSNSLWLTEPGGSMPHSQGFSNNPYPEPN